MVGNTCGVVVGATVLLIAGTWVGATDGKRDIGVAVGCGVTVGCGVAVGCGVMVGAITGVLVPPGVVVITGVGLPGCELILWLKVIKKRVGPT